MARVTQPDLGSETSFTDKDCDHYILQSLMKIDAVEVKVPRLKKKKKKAKPHKEKNLSTCSKKK